jgi:hypothetical protein
MASIRTPCPITNMAVPKNPQNIRQQRMERSTFEKNRNNGMLVTRAILPVEKIISAGM